MLRDIGIMKKLLGKLKHFRVLVREHWYDLWQYGRVAKIDFFRSEHEKTHREAHILRLYHVIEKGLSMPDFRPQFGIERVKELGRLLERYSIRYGKSSINQDPQLLAAMQTLAAYHERHKQLGIDVSDIVPEEFRISKIEALDEHRTRVKPVRKPSAEDRAAYMRVVSSRFSVRAFDPNRQPSLKSLKAAVNAARYTPSVCNRQTSRAHLYLGEQVQNVLALQNGNRGFGHAVPAVFIITSDMRYFSGAPERYQSWIDGGMFSMSLLNALHAEGLGAVALNWSVYSEIDKKLRPVSGIPDYERVIMFIACGEIRDEALAACSLRRSVEELLVVHGSSYKETYRL